MDYSYFILLAVGLVMIYLGRRIKEGSFTFVGAVMVSVAVMRIAQMFGFSEFAMLIGSIGAIALTVLMAYVLVQGIFGD